LPKKVGRGAAFGDYDNDGDIDIFLNNSNQTANLLRNDGGNRNHWLMIKTVGTKSNRDGIGTRIGVLSGGLSQVKEVRSGSSYLSQNDLRVLFGLGHQTTVDQIQVRWPSGIVETFSDVKVGQRLVIKEKEGVVYE
jgi:Fe-S cluster assembly iron-binding protein IscA